MSDSVSHPAHYQSAAGIEVIDVIEKYELGFHLGNALKYMLRAGRKGGEETGLEDLRKAQWYVKRWLDWVEQPTCDHQTKTGQCRFSWHRADKIADAFLMANNLRDAVIELLVSTGFADDINTLASVRRTLSYLNEAIKAEELR